MSETIQVTVTRSTTYAVDKQDWIDRYMEALDDAEIIDEETIDCYCEPPTDTAWTNNQEPSA